MSQQEAHTTTLGDHNYEMFMLPPRKSSRLLTRVAKMVFPALGPLADAFAAESPEKLKQLQKISKDDLNELVGDFFGRIGNALSEHVDPDLLDEIYMTLAEVCHVEGRPLKKEFDIHFMGDLGRMYKWAAWGMQVQWGSTFPALLQFAGGLQRGPVPASASPNT